MMATTAAVDQHVIVGRGRIATALKEMMQDTVIGMYEYSLYMPVVPSLASTALSFNPFLSLFYICSHT